MALLSSRARLRLARKHGAAALTDIKLELAKRTYRVRVKARLRTHGRASDVYLLPLARVKRATRDNWKLGLVENAPPGQRFSTTGRSVASIIVNVFPAKDVVNNREPRPEGNVPTTILNVGKSPSLEFATLDRRPCSRTGRHGSTVTSKS